MRVRESRGVLLARYLGPTVVGRVVYLKYVSCSRSVSRMSFGVVEHLVVIHGVSAYVRITTSAKHLDHVLFYVNLNTFLG